MGKLQRQNFGKISKAVADHFTLPGHKTSDLRFLPFEIIKKDDLTLLASREEFWIPKKKNYNMESIGKNNFILIVIPL